LDAHFHVLLTAEDQYSPRYEFYNASDNQLVTHAYNVEDDVDPSVEFYFNIANSNASYYFKTLGTAAAFRNTREINANEIFVRFDASADGTVANVTVYVPSNIYHVCPDGEDDYELRLDFWVNTPDSDDWCTYVRTMDSTDGPPRYFGYFGDFSFGSSETYFPSFQLKYEFASGAADTPSYDLDFTNVTLYNWIPNALPNQRFATLVANASFGDDSCDPACENGGICREGACLCTSSFLNTTCNTPVLEYINNFLLSGTGHDSCNPACENGGQCQNEVCFCSGGFIGSICNTSVNELLQELQGSSSSTSASVLAVASLFVFVMQM